MRPAGTRGRRWLMGAMRIGGAVTGGLSGVAFVLRQPSLGSNPLSTVAVDPARLEKHVRFLSEECHPRHHLARNNQNKAISYITERLREAGGRIEIQDIPTSVGVYQNVIAHFGATEGPRYVVGAHF